MTPPQGTRSPAKTERPDTQPVVFVVDDDASLRGAAQYLVRSVGLKVEAFASTTEFFAAKRPDAACCLILDVRLPGVSGLDFQAELTKAQIQIPIIFITGHGDIPMSVKAMKAGAVDFLTKPFRDQDLLDAIQVALERSRGKLRKREGDIRFTREIRHTHATGTGSHGPGHRRPPEQAGRGRNRCHRDYGEDASG